MQDVVDVTDGLGRQALAILASLGQQMAVEGVELGRGEALQLDRPEGRDDVCLDVNAVVLPGPRAQVRDLHRRQPLFHQKAPHRPPGRLHERPILHGSNRLVQRRLALPLGAKAALGPLTTLAGRWIRANVQPVRVGAAALADAAPHPAFSSTGKPSITNRRAVGTYSRRPHRKVGRSPDAAARYPTPRLTPSSVDACSMVSKGGRSVAFSRPFMCSCLCSGHAPKLLPGKAPLFPARAAAEAASHASPVV
jgi:hypothetical protein